MRPVHLLRALTGGLLAAAASACLAQAFPAKPVRMLVGASAGGTTDTLARVVGQEMSRSLGQAVVVENRAGAGGNLAAEAVARAAPDGHTLLMSFTSHTINATLYPKLPFDPVADFTPITLVATVPNVLVGHPSVPAADLKALVELARAQPGKLNFAIGGIGSSLHLAGDMFKQRAALDIVNVAYKGTAPALTDVLAGQVQLMFASPVAALQHIRAGKLRAYAVTSNRRMPQLPDVPAVSELYAYFESNAWFGVFGPARLPAEVTRRLNESVVAGLASADVRRRLEAEGAQPVGNTPEAFAAFVREDVRRWEPLVRNSGAKPE